MADVERCQVCDRAKATGWDKRDDLCHRDLPANSPVMSEGAASMGWVARDIELCESHAVDWRAECIAANQHVGIVEAVQSIVDELSRERDHVRHLCEVLDLDEEEQAWFRAVPCTIERFESGNSAWRVSVVLFDDDDICAAPDVPACEYGRTVKAALRKTMRAYPLPDPDSTPCAPCPCASEAGAPCEGQTGARECPVQDEQVTR